MNRIKVVVEIEVPDGATHYTGDLANYHYFYKLKQVGTADDIWYHLFHYRDEVWYLDNQGADMSTILTRWVNHIKEIKEHKE